MSCLGTDKLVDLYRSLSFVKNSDINSRYNIERPEQELIAKYLPSQCNVLEIGGESGTTSLIINSILQGNYKRNHIIVEPDNNSIPKLERVKNLYSSDFQIVHGFIGKTRSIHEEIWDGCKDKKMYSLNEIQSLINDKFDVLVVDCEGAFYNIVNEFPEILVDAKLIIIELDGDCKNIVPLRNQIINKGFTLIHSQCHPYINNSKITTHPFGVFNTVNDLKKITINSNLIGFHEVYAKTD